jgi:GDP-4-dehydro-6-deoxy-D-mannose reductase
MAALERGTGPVLVTGAAGFAGTWLLRELRAAGYPAVAAHRPGESRPADLTASELSWIELDVRDGPGVHAAIAAARPAAVVHLAALAVPGDAARDPALALETNYGAVHHLVQALRAHAPRARLLLISTGEVYGRRAASAPPALEDDPLAPSNLYAATKAAAEQRAVLAAQRDGLDVVRARPFNHTGPGRPAAYAEASFAQQIAAAERASGPTQIRVGNLEPIRDWSDVRDVARAYRVLLESGAPSTVYNVCSGRGLRVREVLDALCARARVRLDVEVDPARFEPIDPERLALVGSPARLLQLGWIPTYALEATLGDLLEDWRGKVGPTAC